MKIEIIVNDEKVELPKFKNGVNTKIEDCCCDECNNEVKTCGDIINLTSFENAKSKVDLNGNLKVKNVVYEIEITKIVDGKKVEYLLSEAKDLNDLVFNIDRFIERMK